MGLNPTITDRATNRARFLGISGTPETVQRVLMMFATNAAKTSHKRGGYRYGDFVLDIEQDVVKDIFIDSLDTIFCTECFGARRIRVTDVCGGCDGVGCEQCNGEGELPRSIPCPMTECN